MENKRRRCLTVFIPVDSALGSRQYYSLLRARDALSYDIRPLLFFVPIQPPLHRERYTQIHKQLFAMPAHDQPLLTPAPEHTKLSAKTPNINT